MSIAVSTAVYPSKILFGLVTSMCAVLILLAYLIVFDIVGSTGFFAKSSLALLCCGFAYVTFFRALTGRKACHWIQVSGVGQIRLSVAVNGDNVNDATQNALRTYGQGELVRLLPQSTLWPSVMILHFRYQSGRTSSIVILTDSLASQNDKTSYRALLVACRWALLHQTVGYAEPEKFL